MAIFTASAANEGAVLDFGGSLPVAKIVTATTTASESSHPKMKAAPFLVPFFEDRTRMKAVRGMGSSVIASPMSMRLRTTDAALPLPAGQPPPLPTVSPEQRPLLRPK